MPRNGPQRHAHQRHGTEKLVQRRDVRGLVGQHGERPERRLAQHQREPAEGKFPHDRSARAPREPRRADQQDHRAEAVRHVDVDVRRGNGVELDHVEALLVVALDGRGIGGRPDLAVRERKIRNRQPCVLMAHRCPEHQLHQHKDGNDRERRAEFRPRRSPALRAQAIPKRRQRKRNGTDQHEEQLRQRAVKNPDLVLHRRHTHPAKHALNQHHAERNRRPPTHGTRIVAQLSGAVDRGHGGETGEHEKHRLRAHAHQPQRRHHRAETNPARHPVILAHPNPAGENGGEQSDHRRHQAMRMFVENPACPLLDREEEHVVAVSRRPVGHGHAGALARQQAAERDQTDRAHGRGKRQPTQRRRNSLVGSHV